MDRWWKSQEQRGRRASSRVTLKESVKRAPYTAVHPEHELCLRERGGNHGRCHFNKKYLSGFTEHLSPYNDEDCRRGDNSQ